jgi:phosphatidylserine synthase
VSGPTREWASDPLGLVLVAPLLVAFVWWFFITTEPRSFLKGFSEIALFILAWNLVMRVHRWSIRNGGAGVRTLLVALVILILAGVLTGSIGWCHDRYRGYVCLSAPFGLW